MFKKVFYNTSAQILGKAITASASLVITLLIGRSLGPAGYGEFTKIFVFIGYFYTFADFGFNAIYVKISSRKDIREFLPYLIGMRLVLAIILAGSAIVISQILPYNKELGLGFTPQVKFGILIASATIITQALFTSSNAFFQKKLRYDLSVIAAVAGTLVILLLTSITSVFAPTIYLYTVSYIFGGLTFVIVAFFIIYKYFKAPIYPSFSISHTKSFLKDAWPIGTALILNLVYFRTDVFILAYTRPPQEVGLYGLAYQFFEAALSIPIFFTNALYPLLTGLYAQDKPEYQKQIKRWLQILTVVSIFLSLGLIIASYLIPPLFGARFNGSQMALVILALGMPFFFISALLWHILIIKNRQKQLIAIYAVGAVVNLLLNLLLIPKYGFLAAAIVTIFSESLITLMLIIFLVRQNKD
ncbi:MAG: flippase [Patescibacteria group bacterium]